MDDVVVAVTVDADDDKTAAASIEVSTAKKESRASARLRITVGNRDRFVEGRRSETAATPLSSFFPSRKERYGVLFLCFFLRGRR